MGNQGLIENWKLKMRKTILPWRTWRNWSLKIYLHYLHALHGGVYFCFPWLKMAVFKDYLTARSDPQMTQMKADVKNGMVMLNGTLSSRKCWKDKKYASFAKTGKGRRFWQKRHTGDVSKISGMWFCCSAVRLGRRSRNHPLRERALHRNMWGSGVQNGLL